MWSKGFQGVLGRAVVSVVVRTCNAVKFARNAIESVLNQDVPGDAYEILVVDDGSTDSTREILESYGNRIRVIELQGEGHVRAANRGIANSAGRYVILLDADDTFESTIISEMLNVLKNDSETGFVYCDYYERDTESGETKVISLKKNIFESVAIGIMFRKDVLEKVGMYDEELIFPEYDILIKVMKKYKGKYIPRPLFTYNRHGGSLASNRETVQKGKEQLFARYGVIQGLRDY